MVHSGRRHDMCWLRDGEAASMHSMGMTYVQGKVSRPDGRGRAVNVRFCVDSGALYSVLPEHVWRALKLAPRRNAEFALADGTVIRRGVSQCTFEISGELATSPVVLGEPVDVPLLGSVTLETLGLMLNPLTRELLPMKLMLARHSPSPTTSATVSSG